MNAAPRPLKILGSAAVTPRGSISSEAIDRRFGLSAGTTFARTGIKQRPVCSEETQVELAVRAASLALRDAGLSPNDIRTLIFASAVGYQSIPSTGPLVQKALGVPDGVCASFDLNSTCLSFLTALDVAGHLVQTDPKANCLIVSAELPSRGLSWEHDAKTASMFGDGAAAVVVGGHPGTSYLIAGHMETYPSASELCRLESGGTRHDAHKNAEAFLANSWFKMEAQALFRHSAAFFPGFLDRLLSKAGWSREDVDVVVPHQASKAALHHLAKRCGFPKSKIIDIIQDHGNQVAASIPTALDFARRSGRMIEGSRVLLLGTSAGVSFGGVALVV